MRRVLFKAVVAASAIAISAILPHAKGFTAELKNVTSIANVRLSTFKSIYILPVDTRSVNYGEAAEKALRKGEMSKGLSETKATLPEAASRLGEKVRAEIDYRALPLKILTAAPTPTASEEILNLDLSIVRFEPGSRVQRAFIGMFGGGKVKVGVKGKFLRNTTSAPLIQFYHERYAAWTYAGEGPDRLLLNAIDDIAKDIGAFMQNNWN